MFMKPSIDERVAVDRVRCFIKWHEPRFDALDATHEPIAEPVGWRRGDEVWISPDAWRGTIFDGDEDAAVDASCALRDLGLLRVQDTRNCQAVVTIRGKSARAYVVKPEIHEWRPATQPYGNYVPAQIEPDRLGISLDAASPPNLAALLEAASRLGLEKAIAILGMQLDPDGRHFQTLLRAQTSLVGTALAAQVKVDEVRFQASRTAELLPALLERIEKALKQDGGPV